MINNEKNDYSGIELGKGGEIQASVEHSSKHIRNFFREIILKKGFLTKEEFGRMIDGKDYWMDAEEMCKRGIATHVMVGGKKITAKKFINKKTNSDEEKVKNHGKKRKKGSNSSEVQSRVKLA